MDLYTWGFLAFHREKMWIQKRSNRFKKEVGALTTTPSTQPL